MRALKPIIPLKDLVKGKTYLEHIPSEIEDSGYDLSQVTILDINDKFMVVYLNEHWAISPENLQKLLSFTAEQLREGDWEINTNEDDYFDEGIVIYWLDEPGVEIYNDYVGEILFMQLDENEEIIVKK